MKEEKETANCTDALRRTKTNERIKFDFVRRDIKFDGKYAIKSERKFRGNAIAASINTYT